MTRNTLLIAMALSITFLAGCYGSGVDRNWGRSNRVNYTAQVKHPEAPESLELSGLDAQSTEQAMETHRTRTVNKTTQILAPTVIGTNRGIGED